MLETRRMQRLQIGTTWVGDAEPVYVVAEAGSNHNGSFGLALRLIDVAVAAGANAVKFQTFKAARMYPKTAGESSYLKVHRSIYDIVEEMEMPTEWVPELAAYCREKSIEFMSTPFDERSADLLSEHVNVFKVASYEMTHTPLLRHIARLGKPMIVSTGTATLAEVMAAAEVIAEEGNDQLILLQCTASYPTPLPAVNARAMLAIRDATGHLVGLSDHSRDPIIAPVLAVALGACVIEKHFTLSNQLPGPDHAFAIEPRELEELVRRVREAQLALGSGRKDVLPEEQELHAFARRSIFATRQIAVGEMLSRENVAVLRCGTLGFGFPPEEFDRLVGRRARHDIQADGLILQADVD
jgi:N,N'-diacetyllegionaminate synthase